MPPCYVYGAQAMAYGIAQAVEHRGQTIAGYVVTKPEGIPSFIGGKRVWGIDELDPSCRPRFLVAVPEYLHAEIVRGLEARGVRDYACIDADAEYSLMKAHYRSTGRLKFLEDYAESTAGDAPEGRMEIYVAKSAGDRPLMGGTSFPEGSVAVQAGAAISPRIPAQFRDDVGENISGKNGHYDELTVTYWAWKNCKANVKGIAHYRRCLAITDEERKALLAGSVDAVLPIPFLCYPDTSMQYARYNRPEAVMAMLDAVGIVHGRPMREEAERVLQGDILYNYNMLVARSAVFDAYCAWMFPVLERVETLCRDMLLDGVHTRICGHLGELLGTIYFRACGQALGLRIVHGKKVWFV